MEFPLGVVSTVSSDTHVGFHVTVNGIERIGVFVIGVVSRKMFGG